MPNSVGKFVPNIAGSDNLEPLGKNGVTGPDHKVTATPRTRTMCPTATISTPMYWSTCDHLTTGTGVELKRAGAATPTPGPWAPCTVRAGHGQLFVALDEFCSVPRHSVSGVLGGEGFAISPSIARALGGSTVLANSTPKFVNHSIPF